MSSALFLSPPLLLLQMKLSMEEFRNLAARYGDLYQSSFDADSATLRNVELYPTFQSTGLGYFSLSICLVNMTLKNLLLELRTWGEHNFLTNSACQFPFKANNKHQSLLARI